MLELDDLTFLSGAELADGSLMIGAQSNRPEILDIRDSPHTLMGSFSPDGTWESIGSGAWISTGVCPNATADGIAFLGPEGEFLDLRRDGHTRNELLEAHPKTRCTLRFLKAIDGTMYAGGTNNYLFNFDGETWQEIGTKKMRDAPVPRSFDGVTGFHASELYAFGWGGALWSNAAGRWQQIRSPADVILTDGDVHDDNVLIGGLAGMILCGRGKKWKVVQNDISSQDIWSVCSFEDAVYFSMASGILRLKDNVLSPFKSIGPNMRTAMSLFVGPSGLWSVGAHDIAVFDGQTWRTVAQSNL